jgi:hypothetical protein
MKTWKIIKNRNRTQPWYVRYISNPYTIDFWLEDGLYDSATVFIYNTQLKTFKGENIKERAISFCAEHGMDLKNKIDNILKDKGTNIAYMKVHGLRGMKQIK